MQEADADEIAGAIGRLSEKKRAQIALALGDISALAASANNFVYNGIYGDPEQRDAFVAVMGEMKRYGVSV